MMPNFIFPPFYHQKTGILYHLFQGPLRYGLQISIFLHALIFLFLFLEIIDFINPAPFTVSTQVQVISEADFEKIKTTKKKAPEKKPPKKKIPEKIHDFAATLEAVNKVVPKKVAPKKKPELLTTQPKNAPKILKNLDNLVVANNDADLLQDQNLKNLTKKTQYLASESEITEDENVATVEAIENALSAEEITILKEQISLCWNPPLGAKDIDKLIIKVRLTLNEKGFLQDARIVHNLLANRTDPFYRSASENALRAVYHPDCTPLKLPLHKYDAWHKTTLTFNPSQILQ